MELKRHVSPQRTPSKNITTINNIVSRPKGVEGIACNTKNAEIGICEVRVQYPGEELPGEDRKASIEYVSHQQSTKSFSIMHYIIIFWTVLEMLVEPHIT